MSEFEHSQTLFYSDDGIPLEFNIQYVKDKASIKSLIEHGGGLCTLKDDVTHLVSPGSAILNVNSCIKLISTSYVYDCAKQNYLLDSAEYRFVINEMETSDISDNSQDVIEDHGKTKCKDNNVNNSVDILNLNKTPSPNTLPFPNSNHDFDFQDSEDPINVTVNNETDNYVTSLQPISSSKPDANMIEKECNEACLNSDNLENFHTSVTNGEKGNREIFRISKNNQILNDHNHVAVQRKGLKAAVDADIVSSSQPDDDVLDLFDRMVLKKAEESPVKNDNECLSQSYTISSSADAQVSPKVSSNMSAEIFDEIPDAPDSASQTTERQRYINDLEKKIDQILQKPSPKSIQDKITFVKYICTVKKVAPAIVLQTLQNF